MSLGRAIVSIVDDDPSVRKALDRLLRAAGFNVEAFASAQAFLDAYNPGVHGCVVLDLEMPGLSGLDLQDTLLELGGTPTLIFLTGRAEVPDGIRAMKHGAMEFLTKPVMDEVLIAAIRGAIDLDRDRRARQERLSEILSRIATLTPREAEVFRHVISGRLNKQIAESLGTVEKTVKVHRARVMEKMQAQSLAQLVQLAATAGAIPGSNDDSWPVA